MDQWSANETIKDLINQLQGDGLTGKLKINRIHTDEDQIKMDIDVAEELENDRLYQSY